MAPSETHRCTTFLWLFCLFPLQLDGRRDSDQQQWLSPRSAPAKYGNDSDILLNPAAAQSLQWVEHLDLETLRELKKSVGVEVYDESCTYHIVKTLTNPTVTWWTHALHKDPLIKDYMEEKYAKEREAKWNEVYDETKPGNTGFGAWFSKAWQWIKNVWKKFKKWISSTRLLGKGGAINKYREKIKAIQNRQLDADGKPATVCSLDHATLKLFPFSRAFHNGVHENDGEGKCKVGSSKNALGLRQLGRMDADRVIRSTQMALYQTCYYRCVRFVELNFEKTSAHSSKKGDKPFCAASYEEQRKRMNGPGYEKLLAELLNNKESDIYRQCQALFEGIDGAELIDFVLERACFNFPRPTPFYVPSENAPLDLYNTKTENNEPVCKPEKKGTYAESTLHRTCPEGTHCHCQRKEHADHITANQKSWKITKIFNWNAWGGVKHCTARRKAGKDALVFVDADALAKTKWYHFIARLKKARKTTKVGVGLLLVSAVLGTVAASLGGAAGAGAGAAAVGSGFASFFGGIFAGLAAAGGAVLAANPVSLLIGGSIAFGLAGLYVIQWGMGFDCSKAMGCYPLECKFERSLNDGKGQCYMAAPKHGLTDMPLWWLPPPDLKCAYKGKAWYRNLGLGDGRCLLEACSLEEMAAGKIGYFKSGRSKKDKLDFMNCQPVNVKDMNVHQQHKLLETLRGDGHIKDSLSHVGVSTIPQCTMNEHCRDGIQTTDDWSEPFCHHREHVCYHPVVTSMKVEIGGSSEEEWKKHVRKALSNKLFKMNPTDGEKLIKIIEEPNPSLLQIVRHSTKAGIHDGNPMEKKIRIIVKATQTDGLDSSMVKSMFRQEVGKTTTSANLDLIGALGSNFRLKILEAGAMCPARTLPAHATAACTEAVKPEGGCKLVCKVGWKAKSTTWCDDGTWADEIPESRRSTPPAWTSLPPLFECQEVPCPELSFPRTCPRAVPGCFQWKDSACDRGGLSGSQPICEVEPSAGYKLADPASNKWRCELSGNWVVPEGIDEPKMKEAKCTMEGSKQDQQDWGLVDWDSGVEEVCEQAYSGIVNPDNGPGFCAVTCKRGTQIATEDPLHCTPEKRWAGKARCEPIHCDESELLATHDMTRISKFNCPDKVPAGAKAGVCDVECEVGYELMENEIECTHDGRFTGRASCVDEEESWEPYFKDKTKAKRNNAAVHRPHPPLLGLLTCIAMAATWRR